MDDNRSSPEDHARVDVTGRPAPDAHPHQVLRAEPASRRAGVSSADVSRSWALAGAVVLLVASILAAALLDLSLTTSTRVQIIVACVAPLMAGLVVLVVASSTVRIERPAVEPD